MKRSEFFSEMRKGLFQTMKEVTYPILSDDIEKIDSMVDEMAGVKWYTLGSADLFSPGGVHDFYFHQQPIVVLITEAGELKAFGKSCGSCETMMQWISYQKKLKCMMCDEEFFIEDKSDEQLLKKYPIKERNNTFYIGVN